MFVAYLSSVLTPSISCETAAVVISTWERFTVLVDGYRCEGEAQGRSGLLQWNCQVVMVESGGSPSGTCGRVWNKDPARPRATATVPGPLYHHRYHSVPTTTPPPQSIIMERRDTSSNGTPRANAPRLARPIQWLYIGPVVAAPTTHICTFIPRLCHATRYLRGDAGCAIQ